MNEEKELTNEELLGYEHFKCDGCGNDYFSCPKSDDGENKFCSACWLSIELETEVMNNEKQEGRE